MSENDNDLNNNNLTEDDEPYDDRPCFDYKDNPAHKKYANNVVNKTESSKQHKSDKAPTHPNQQNQQTFGVADEIEKLANLKEKGILTPEEFDEQKKVLLNKYSSVQPSSDDEEDDEEDELENPDTEDVPVFNRMGHCRYCGEKLERGYCKRCHKPGTGLDSPVAYNITAVVLVVAAVLFILFEIYSNADTFSKEQKETTTQPLDYYKEQCVCLPYDEIARSPEKFEGKLIKYTGTVAQVQESASLNGSKIDYMIRLQLPNADEYSLEFDYVYVKLTRKKSEAHILKDDNITAYGECTGTKKYITVLGNSLSIPSMDAAYAVINKEEQ